MCYVWAMARLRAFRGTTYDAGRVAADDVIAPPYDVVGPAERLSLAARSPYNAIEVELPAEAAGADRYHHAASIFASWHRDGIVRVADRPSLYVYRMSFREEDGSARATTGVLGALGLDVTGSGEVLPHEQTTSKDKHDRLSLLQASHVNFSPIWGLTVAPGFRKSVDDALAAADGPPWRAVDDEAVTHELWTVTDPGVLAGVSAAAASAPVLIADGHHRYDTACNFYGQEPDLPGADAILAFVVELSEEELAVQPIHRLVRGVDPGRLVGELAPWFAAEAGPSDPALLRQAMSEQGALGLFTAAGTWLLRPLASVIEAAADELDTSRLAVALDGLGSTDVAYQPGMVEARGAVEQGLAEAAFFVKPVSVAQIARTAHGGRRMPPKSTYFRPKPRTGMVFRELEAG